MTNSQIELKPSSNISNEPINITPELEKRMDPFTTSITLYGILLNGLDDPGIEELYEEHGNRLIDPLDDADLSATITTVKSKLTSAGVYVSQQALEAAFAQQTQEAMSELEEIQQEMEKEPPLVRKINDKAAARVVEGAIDNIVEKNPEVTSEQVRNDLGDIGMVIKEAANQKQPDGKIVEFSTRKKDT